MSIQPFYGSRFTWNWTFNETCIAMFDFCTYCIFTLYSRATCMGWYCSDKISSLFLPRSHRYWFSIYFLYVYKFTEEQFTNPYGGSLPPIGYAPVNCHMLYNLHLKSWDEWDLPAKNAGWSLLWRKFKKTIVKFHFLPYLPHFEF